MAGRLVRDGVRPGDRVGLLMERSVHTYVSLLAVLKAGAAFVPLDPSYPSDRIAFIAEDAGLALLATTSDFRDAVASAGCPALFLDAHPGADAPGSPGFAAPPAEKGDALCYIIYTSGTTGRPKGVAINHSSICNFLAACTPIYGVTAGDRVYQGMTLAFDFSVEEIWPTFAAGATLVAGPTDHRRFGAGLNDFLIEQEITVMSCVPTLLATLERDVPTLRLLNAGGEACPADLVKRWSRPGRRMLNTYGPTEATVTATWTELRPDRPVTIGRPMPTYTVCLLDESLRPVPTGTAGEICIGGPGVAVGYINRPELTAEKFIADPASHRPGGRLYRTGDLGREAPNGEIEYLGRIDTQVKLRGYRIELAEIEAVLLEDAAVANALVAVTTVQEGNQELAAYVTLRAATDLDALRRRLHDSLRSRLPAYMTPAFIEVLDAFPMLPSGKADRSRLPAPKSPRLTGRGGDGEKPQAPLECTLAAAWGKVLGRDDVSLDDDFFLDLGGHSLTAALVVSHLRQDPAFRRLSIGDLYTNPTVRGLARQQETAKAERNRSRDREGAVEPAPRPHGRGSLKSSRVRTAGAVQFSLLDLVMIPWLAPTAAMIVLLTTRGLSLFQLIAGMAAALAAGPLIALLLPPAVKWLLLGRVKPGRYPLWGWFFCRWWLVKKVMHGAPLDYLAGSPLLAPYLRLLGARIGRGCHLGSARIDVPDMIEIGDGASIGYDADLAASHVEDGCLHVRPLRVGAGAYVGANAAVQGGGVVGDGARVAEQSLVAEGQTIPGGETWAGSPAQRADADPKLDALSDRQPPRRWPAPVQAGFALGVLLLELLPLLTLAPGLALIWLISEGNLALGLALAPVAGLLQVLTVCGIVLVGKRLAAPSVRPGVYPLRSWFGLRKWFSDRLMVFSLASTESLYGTLYLLPFLRLLGARVGRRAEVSTVSHIDPDLLTLGEECFVADLAVVGAARVCNGFVLLGETEVGARGFVGNAALVPGDTRLPHDSLIGVLSVAPNRAVEPGSSWLGSPPIFLPRRQSSGCFDESVTYRPPARLVACRLAIEFLRVVLPSSLEHAGLFLAASAGLAVLASTSAWLLVAALPAVFLGVGLLLTLVTAALKWLVVGRYRPRVEPQWSHFVWRTEFITGLYEGVAVPWLLQGLAGTPMMAPVLRLFGARVGRRAFMETTFLTEFDLVRVGDDAEVGEMTSLQTHLFEDRVMKMSTVTIGAGATVGSRAVVLYDAELADGASLDSLSLAMKGESMPAGTRWRGIPARPVD